MKNFISFCLLILLSATVHCQAQSSRAYKVAFNSAEAEGYVSDVFTIGEFPEAAFTSLSAYIMIPNATVTLEYRIKNKDGWEVWKNMSLNEEGETPDRTTFYAPYINEAFEAIQFRAGQALNEEVVFRLFFPSVSQNIEPKMKAANDSICNCQKPAFCGRDCWCPSGDCPKDSIPDYTTPTHIIIHHSAGSSVSNNWPAVVKAIWDFHVKTNGWSDVGYNWLIDPNGVIYEGRGDSVLGAHFSCMNSGTTGICMLGNFETAQPTFSMISSLSYLAAWESCTENIPPMDTRWHASSQLNLPSISSHRDANTSTAPNGCPKGTLCPGANLYVMLPTIRQAVDNN
ncbi:MAG: N-acetylmuramoyl-L-alanine amidase, partial [Owenweeksia sp.]